MTALSQPRTGFPAFLNDAIVLTRRSLRHTIRQVDGLLFSVILPVMLLLMFVYVFGGAIQTGTDYLNYVVPGIIILAAGYSASHTAIAVTTDMTTAMIDRFRSLPMSSAALLTGHVLASLVRNLFSTGIVIALAIAIGFRPVADPLAWLGVLGIATLFILAITWLSAMVGVLARSVDAANGFSFGILFLPYISSAFVPVDTLPAILQPIAQYQPATPVIESMRALLLGTPIGANGWLALAWCIGIMAVCIPLAAFIYRRRTAG